MTPSQFDLPAEARAYLSGLQAQIAQTSGTPATPMDALMRVMQDHYILGVVAAHQGHTVSRMCVALALGDLRVTPKDARTEGQQ